MEIVRIGSAEVLGVAIALLAECCPCVAAGEAKIAPSDLPAVGTVDERFQSFNIEMVSVTGGPFWKPYARSGGAPKPEEQTQSAAHKNADLFAVRSPIDLANLRLRKFASALSPAYLRVSGTWANTTFFARSDAGPTRPPDGYKSVLTRRQWNGVIDFSKAIDAPIVTSFAISSGTRDSKGGWKPDQAREIISATRAAGGHLVAAEFMNEPDLPAIGGAPAGYGGAAFARDLQVFHAFMKQAAPDIMVLGPGAIGSTPEDSALFLASSARIDAVSYHYYGALSERCAGAREPDFALSEEWLSGTDRAFAFYASLRDRIVPGKPIWLTETAEAACGGDRWSATFLDSFRYLDQLGRLARAGVQIVMHNTLIASDYGLLDEVSLEPRPNYWAALLWRQLMGTIVLDPRMPIQRGLHVYAHCQRHAPGAVVLLVINNDPQTSHELVLPHSSERFTLDATALQDTAVRLNGVVLKTAGADPLPKLGGLPVNPGSLRFAPTTITFLAIPDAGNRNCN